LFKLGRIFEKSIAVRAIQEASREASGPLSQFSPSYSLNFEVGLLAIMCIQVRRCCQLRGCCRSGCEPF
jgi:hypothetical protein